MATFVCSFQGRPPLPPMTKVSAPHHQQLDQLDGELLAGLRCCIDLDVDGVVEKRHAVVGRIVDVPPGVEEPAQLIQSLVLHGSVRRILSPGRCADQTKFVCCGQCLPVESACTQLRPLRIVHVPDHGSVRVSLR